MTQFLGNTMLIERFCGVALYCICLFFICYQMKHSCGAQSVKRHLNSFLFILVVMGALYIPGDSADLYRWREIWANWVNVSVWDFISSFAIKSDTPLGYLLMYLCQKTGIDGLLPGICAFFFYLNVFHVFKEVKVRSHASESALAGNLLFFMAAGSLLEVISGVRCFLAFSIVARCIFDEIYCGKQIVRSILPYAIAVLLHTAVLPVIAIRLISLMFEKRMTKTVFVTNLLFLSLIGFLIVRYGTGFVGASFQKASNYILDASNHYFYYWEYLIGALQFIVIGKLLFDYRRFYRNIHRELDGLYRILVMLAICEAVLVFSYSIFHRFLVISSILSIPLMTYVIDEKNKQRNSVAFRNLELISFIILFIACARGNLCGYKFFML